MKTDAFNRYDVTIVDGRRLKRRRIQVRKTQKQVAEATGLSRGWISVIEGDSRCRVSRTAATSLAEALDCPVSELERREDQGSSQTGGGSTFDSPLSSSAPSRPATQLEDILAALESLVELLKDYISTQSGGS
jgi:transcriptional regulator with XRE-family HTH domain